MRRETTVIIAAGACMLALSFGVRSIFGVVLDPLSEAYGWDRSVFSFSLAMQNLVWGAAQPAFGMIADRMGDRRALWLGLGLYLAGMVVAILGATPLAMHLGAGVLVGAGIAGTSFGLVLSVVGRSTTEAERSKALGLTAALGSLGQVAMPLIAGWTTAALGWQATLILFAALLVPMAFCIPHLNAKVPLSEAVPEPLVPTGALLARAFGHASYVLLTLGFFVCGFHVAFITAHFPAYVYETCGSLALGGAAIAIVGAGNVVGTYVSGQLGARYRKPWLLSAIYGLRALVIFVFIMIPPSPVTVVIFSAAMGLLWLSTVPLTAALVATMFGPRYMGTLYGLVFLSHQVGSFTGVWMGGRVYDLYGSYDVVWWVAIALGLASAAVHLPIRERAWAPAAA
ncbi:MAG TPA: MFS transporter [Thermohalobaculum sp.]|nr:MFS transporter [Thermohalobaculum sp.]